MEKNYVKSLHRDIFDIKLCENDHLLKMYKNPNQFLLKYIHKSYKSVLGIN